jgi:hypothetical protein
MPAPVLSMGDLALRRAAAWGEYQRDHVPGITRRQVFTGGDVGVTDHTARLHEMMPKLVAKLDMLTRGVAGGS